MIGALIALAIAASPALACKGNEEIFSDDFTEDTGFWTKADWITIGGGSMELKLPSGYMGTAGYRGDVPKDFDLCFDVTYPQMKAPAGMALGGIDLWFKDHDNKHAIITAPIGIIGAGRMANGKFTPLAPFRPFPSLKTGPGQKNTLRVTVKGNSVTLYANDQRVSTFRATPIEGDIFGFHATSEQDNVNAWKFSNLKITNAPE
jgi:hypothetical protein